MIRLENLTKAYWYKGQAKYIAKGITATFPSGIPIGLLGRNGAGKSTLLQMIAGTISPDSGRVRVQGTISWPIGLAGGVHPELSGAQNVRFIARIYGVDTEELVDFVEGFAELGLNFRQPVRTYSSGMRSRLNFGISMGIRFDTYLIDEVTAVGDAAFRAKSQELFDARMASSGAILVTHSSMMLKAMCKAGAVLENGELRYFDDVDEAIEVNDRNMLGANYASKSKVYDPT